MQNNRMLQNRTLINCLRYLEHERHVLEERLGLPLSIYNDSGASQAFPFGIDLQNKEEHPAFINYIREADGKPLEEIANRIRFLNTGVPEAEEIIRKGIEMDDIYEPDFVKYCGHDCELLHTLHEELISITEQLTGKHPALPSGYVLVDYVSHLEKDVDKLWEGIPDINKPDKLVSIDAIFDGYAGWKFPVGFDTTNREETQEFLDCIINEKIEEISGIEELLRILKTDEENPEKEEAEKLLAAFLEENALTREEYFEKYERECSRIMQEYTELVELIEHLMKYSKT